MKYRLIFLLFLILFAILLTFSASAEGRFEVVQGPYDRYVFIPGTYDISVGTSAEEPTYQWYAKVGRHDDSRFALEDDDAWTGVHTAHLSVKASEGMLYGTGWEDLFFFCVVTDKNGVSREGPDVNMVVYSHEALLQRLEKDGTKYVDVGLRLQNGATLEYAGETDGVKYYNTYGDQGLIPYMRTGPLDSEVQMSSEVKVKTEIYVTSDGKTTRFDGALNGFVPKRYGQPITFRWELALYVNDVRTDTLDTRTAVVNVKMPDYQGFAATKYACSLLEERYNESRKLTYLEKNTFVALIEKSGGYRKVAVNGYFGFLPETALNIGTTVDEVGIDVCEPSSYSGFETSIAIYDMTRYVKYDIDPVTWYDRNTGNFLTGSDMFLPGHTYTLSVWLKAKDGYRFPLKNGNPNVYAEINGRKAEVHVAYEQDPEKVIEITYTFTHVHDPKKVNRVYPTCTAPGKELHYHCDCGAEFEDNAGKVRITDESWGYMPPLGHRESGWMSDGTNHYKVCQRRECGITLTGTKGAHTGGKATCKNGAFCEVCGLEYGSKASHVWTDDWTYTDETGHAHYCLNLCGQRSVTEPHVPGPAATSTSPQVCTVCGYVISPATNHVHELEKVEAKEATCTSPGNTEYYVCKGCGKLFSDKNGTNETSFDKVTLASSGHTASEEWKYDEETHWKICLKCGVIMPDTEKAHVFTCAEGVCCDCGYEKGTEVSPQETEQAETDPSGTETGTDLQGTEKETETPAAEETGEPGATEKPEEKDGKKKSDGINLWIIFVVAAASFVAAGAAAFIVLKKKK